MTINMIFEMLIKAVGGLGIFLLGMKQMSEGMQAMAGEKLRALIRKVTDNRFIATGIGAAITALIQSSSVTTVMVVGMVNAGVMTLTQSIGVILGADIGTTITAWIVSLKLAEYGLPLLGVSAFFYLFTKSDRVRYIAIFALGLGMIFFGLEIMKSGFYPLRSNEDFISLWSRFSPSTFWGLLKCVLVGAFVTAVVQSSSATVAITITLAQTGIIDYQTAVALVLGENIGTTITAYLASLGATTWAKRAAFAHISIKIMGVLLMLPLFYSYIGFLNIVLPDSINIGQRIAVTHSVFNILLVSLFIWFIKPLAKFLTILVRDKNLSSSRLSFIDFRMLDVPALAVQQSFQSIVNMADDIDEMNQWLENILTKSNDKIEQNLIRKEVELDVMQKDIMEYIGALMAHTLSHEDTIELRKQLRLADEYESISDYLIVLLKLRNKVKKNSLKFANQDKTQLYELHAFVRAYVKSISDAMKAKDAEILKKAMSDGKIVNQKIKQHRAVHLNRLGTKHGSPMFTLFYMDMLSAYRRIKDHAFNIAEVVAGEK
ncbi:Na/Pi cotransporter family protein [candidate division KSB1 bacterium]|nr:Na/Pi cotransporter family protein [candidate division KSB1 bacterium]